MAHKIDSKKCVSCGACKCECPVEAIREGDSTYIIDPQICIDCGACPSVCPVDAIDA